MSSPLTEFRRQLRREIRPRRWMKPCPTCHGDGCVEEKEESFSFSIYEQCAMCKGSGKVEAKI